MLRFASCLGVLVVLVGVVSVEATVIKNISTGIDETGMKAPDGNLDHDYVIGAGGTAGHVGEIPHLVRAMMDEPKWYRYVGDVASDDSAWIALDPEMYEIAVRGGTYFFETAVDLTGFVPGTAEIVGLRYAADDRLISVFVNDTEVFTQLPTLDVEFEQFYDIGDVGQGEFHAGLNTVRFEVLNLEDHITTMCLRVEGVVQGTPIPEPSTLILLTIGAVGLLAYSWRRRR